MKTDTILSALGGALLMLLILSIALNAFQYDRGKNCMAIPSELPAMEIQ